LVSFSAWLYGRWTAPIASSARQYFAPFAAVVLVFAGAGFCFLVMPHGIMMRTADLDTVPPTRTADADFEQNAGLDWQPYRRMDLNKHLAQGRSVLVMWTADW
jgi:thiol:disulfide interchange protein